MMSYPYPNNRVIESSPKKYIGLLFFILVFTESVDKLHSVTIRVRYVV